MQHVACPGCGAEVDFRSSASVMAVCEYCRTTVLKDADTVRDLGKMGVVLEDYSPLQIGSAGVFQGRHFSLIGRLQLRYPAGFWNEWFVLFDDGGNGWLSDASGQYTMTFEKPAPAGLPAFTALKPGQSLTLAGHVYTASDVREATCTGGAGELPFQVGAGWQARVADFRYMAQFVTIDFSDETTKLYVGEAVTLSGLKASLLRDSDAITDTSGRVKGKIGSLSCPNCGSAVQFTPGATVALICPSCHSTVDVSGATAEVLKVGSRLAAIPLTLELGAVGNIDGASFTVLGALKRSSLDGSAHWTEYLLYEPQRGFLWLIESNEGWERATVEDVWPVWDQPESVLLDQRRFTKTDDYGARVDAAIGAFNWQVAVGDTVRVVEFSGGDQQLAGEISDTELTWSRARRVPLDQVRAWFGDHVHADEAPHPSHVKTAKAFLVLLAVVDVIPMLFGGGLSFVIVLFTAAFIFFPALMLDAMEAKT
jgi:hypothetical protein